jgi:NADPH:quinone reductase-like Zn-dependent oxidoreductase
MHSHARFLAAAISIVVCACAVAATATGLARPAAIPTTQKQYRLVRSGGGTTGPFRLEMVDAPVRAPGAGEVLVRVHATSLNRHDVFVLNGQMTARDNLVPLSDGAGEVVAVGEGARRLHVGDHVASLFFQGWISGRAPNVAGTVTGSDLDGMLAQYVTLNEQNLAKLPAFLSFEEGATLPCAGVTAWNGLVTQGHMQAGDYVLLEGTGGVSIFGLQFAVAAGAKPIITSSHDEKLERAKALGAVGTVNYKTTPDWEKSVRALTGGLGVQQVLEVGGKDSLPHSLASLGRGGHIALIGGLGGFGGEIPATSLMGAGITASGIYVGSRENFEAMNAFIDRHKIKPVVDKVFDFKDAKAAFEAMEADSFFGKIVIKVE